MKLFEIPVYAMSKEKLAKRVELKCQKIQAENADRNVPEEHMKQVIAIETFPQRLWEYNHIIGYIVISKNETDIILEWYAPIPGVEKYHWNSWKKHYVQNTHLGGYHFYIDNMSTSVQLRERLNELVSGYVRELNKRGYYADLEAFNNIGTILDYEKFLRG